MIIKNVKINDYERVDDLHRNGYLIIQDPKRFCFGVDAVLLAAFSKVNENESAIDLGTGTGIIPIMLEARNKAKKYIGIDIQQESVEMAKRSVILNSLQDKISIECCDIKDIFNVFSRSSFDVVTSNPPYINKGGGIINDFNSKAIARHEILCSLEDVIYAASGLLKFGGRFYMIHRPHRLTDVFYLLRSYKLEPKVIRFVHPYLSKEPNMLLIEAIRSGKPMLKVLPPLIIYNDDGNYTDEIYSIYYE